MTNGNEQGVLELDNNSLECAEGCDVDSLVQDLTNHENVSINPDQEHIEVELDVAIDLLETGIDHKAHINHIIELLNNTEFVSQRIVTMLTNYLWDEDLELVDLCIKGLVIICNKTKNITLTSEHINKLSLLLTRVVDNTDIVTLLEEAQKQHIPFSKITVVRLIDYLAGDITTQTKRKLISLLEMAQIKSNLDEQLVDLFCLAKELLDIDNYSGDDKKLFFLLRALKTKIDFSKELTHEQCELLNYGLRYNDVKIVDVSNECLELLFLKTDIIIEESFLQLILPIIEDDVCLKLITRLFNGDYKRCSTLLNYATSRLEVIFDKGDLLQQESLNVIYNLVQQRVQLSQKMIYFVEKCLDDKKLQVLAFKILKEQLDQGRYHVTEKYLDVCKQLAVKFKLSDFYKELESSKVNDEHLNILTTLLEIKHINNDILSKCSSYEFLARELLLYDLVKRTGTIDPISQETFNKNWTQLESKHNYGLVSKDRDNILLQLIRLQQDNNLSLKHINQILELLIDLPEDILIKIDKTQDIICALKLMWLKYKIFDNLEDAELQSLYQGFFEQNNWPVNTVSLFLQHLPNDIQTTQISNFLHFIYENEISYVQINELLQEPFEESGKMILSNWQTILAKHVLDLYLQNKSIGSKDRVKCEIIQLLQIGWSINNIKRLIGIIIDKGNDNVDNLQTLLNAIQIICYYNIAADFNSKDKSNIFNVIEDNNIESIDFILRNFAIEQKFQLSSEKSIEVLLSEIAEKNVDDLYIQSLINNNVLKYENKSIEQKYNSCSTVLVNDRAIKFWSEEDIQHWSNLIKGSIARLPEYQNEILAVIKRATILDSKHEPRVVQMLAVLLMLYTDEEVGRLIQVATGEGKSMIVAMLAVIKALREEVVDVVTSSSILAKRDAAEKTKFYSMFNLTVQDNSGEYIGKDCYTKNIVYGSVENFQFDLLRDMSSKHNIRKGRLFGTVIIDEVDSMLIDEGSRIAKTSSHLPHIEYLEHLLSLTWQYLEKIDQYFYFDYTTKQLLWIKSEFTINNDQIYLTNNGDDLDDIVRVHNRFEYTRFLLSEYLKQCVNNDCLIIPEHLRDFVLYQIDKWISSAIYAKYVFTEGKHYLVANHKDLPKKIVPVDFANTGILQFDTSWSNGLHQFLQIKHGLKISPENLTTSFISNVGFFNKYGKSIYGMTGTLGNQDTQKLLEDIYPIKISLIPTYKHKKFIELPGIIANDNTSWGSKIVNSITHEAKNGRAVLVICETINHVKKIRKLLINDNYPIYKIRNYTRNDGDEYLAINSNIECGEIILATNLAGRGTDLKTTIQVEKAGGLHVCLTFLANNQRIEDQAFGRTARQGKNGTGQLIVNGNEALDKLNYPHTTVNNIASLKELRESVEQSRLKKVKYSGFFKTLISDELFLKFHELCQIIKKDADHLTLKQLEESWGFWLHQINLDGDDDLSITDISLQAHLQEIGLRSHKVVSGDDSFYHSIIHQINQRYISIANKIVNINKLKYIIINHIIDNPLLYNNVTEDLEKFANTYFQPSKWQDDSFIKAVARIFAVNIILVEGNNSYKYYKKLGTNNSLYIARGVNGNYLSLIKINSDDIVLQPNVGIIKVVDDTNNAIMVNNNADGTKEKILKILDNFKILEAQLAETQGRQKREIIKNEYEKFKQEVLAKYKTNEIIKNPSYETLRGNLLLKSRAYNAAIEHYSQAINLDKTYSFIAHYKKAYATIRSGDQDINDAKVDLLAAKTQLEEHLIPQLEAIQMMLVSQGNITADSDLSKQFINKINLLKLHLEHIDQALCTIETITQNNLEAKKDTASGGSSTKSATKFKVVIDQIKNIKDFFEKTEIPKSEIAELRDLGLDSLFTLKAVEEKQDTTWGTIFGSVLGIGQIAFGVAVILCGGAALGASIVTEGVKDVFKAIMGEFSQGFSFERYFTSKAISYSVSMISMGWNNFKTGIQAIKTGAVAAASTIKNITMQALGKEAVKHGAAVATTSTVAEIAKEGVFKAAIEIAKKEIPRAIISVGAQHAINFVANKVSDRIIEEFHADIAKSVREDIAETINDELMINIIDRAIAIDTIIGKHKYIVNLRNQIQSILRQEENNLIEISTTIIKSITQQYHSGIYTCITVAEKIAVINEILIVIDNFKRKLYSRLPNINSQLPDTKEIFKTYIQHDLSSDESDKIYNLLLSEEIINEQGKVQEVNKILTLNLGEENEAVKTKILKFCKKVQATENIDTQAVRTKIATNIEYVITNRIINLIKGKILNPAVESGISSVSNDIMSKLSQASLISKAKIKQELQKNYSQVVLVKEVEEEKDNAQKILESAYEETIVTKVEGFTPPKDIPQIKDTEGYLYLDASAQQLARPIYLFRNGELDRVAGAHYKYSHPFNIDYVDGQGWKKHKSFQQPTSLLKLIQKESGRDLTETFYNIASDPKVKTLRLYDLYEHSCLQIHHTSSGHVSYLSPLYPPTATQYLKENSSGDIAVPTTTSAQVKLSSIGNLEASTSGTGQAMEISLPVFEAMALKYGPKTASVFAKFGMKSSILASNNDIVTTTTNTSYTKDNSAPAEDTETPTTSTTWKSGICKVPQEDMGVLRSAYCKGETYVVEKYQHARQVIEQKVEETPKTALARIQEVALTSLKNPNVMATYVEAAGQGMLYVADHSNQLTAKHLPKTRAIINTAAEIGKDALLITGATIWQQLPEATKPIIKQTLVMMMLLLKFFT